MEGLFQPIQDSFRLSGGYFKTDGCTFVIPKDQTSRAYRACFLSDMYESEERSLVQKVYQNQTTVVIELVAVWALSQHYHKLLADKTPMSCEGNPLRAHAASKQKFETDGFVNENCAITNAPTATFYLHPNFIVGAHPTRNSRPVRVPGRSLAELDARYGPSRY